MGLYNNAIRILVLPAAGWFAFSLSPMSAGQASKKASGQSTADAAAVFKRQCAGCHGADGEGQTTMGKTFHLKALSSAEVQNMTDSQLFDTIAKGKGRMPAYENSLGHDKIHELVAYIRGLGKK